MSTADAAAPTEASAPDSASAKVAKSPAGSTVAHAGRLRSKGTPASLRKRSDAFSKNITKRGMVALKKKKEDVVGAPRVSSWVIGLFIFVLVGSTIFGVLANLGKSIIN